MSRSMHGPWIKNCLMGMLAGEESYSAHQTRCVQVIAVKADARVLLISDTEIAINAFLTEECFNELLEIYPIETIKQSQINLSEFYFSTVSQAAGNMDMEFLRKLGICPPFALHCFKVDYLGASDSTTIGKPSDVNQSHALIGELRKFKYADLLDRLAERQYPLPRLLKTLPDWEGTFIADFTAVPADQPLQSTDFIEPEVQSRLIEAIDSFDIRHTLEVLPALLLDEAGNLGETQVSSVPRLVPTTRSQNQTSSGSSGAKSKSKGKDVVSKNATANNKNSAATSSHQANNNSTQHTQEATAGWSETMREDDDYDAYLSLLQSNNPYNNGYAHTWDPLGDSQLTPDADPNVSNASGNKNNINDFSYPDSESDEDNQKNGADDMEIIPRDTPRTTQTNSRGINNRDVYHRLDTGTQSSQLDEHMLFSQPLPLTSAITEIVEGRATRSRHNTLTDVALPLTGSSTSTTHTSTTSHSTTLNTTAPPLTVSPPLAQRSPHSTQSSVSDKHTASTLSTLAGVDLLQSSQSQHSLNTHHSANSKHSSASKGSKNSKSSTEVRVVRTNADGQVIAVEVQRVDPSAAALSIQQLLGASQAAPITSPVEDHPYRPNGNGSNAKSKKQVLNKTKDNSGSDSESSDSSSDNSDGLPRGIKVVPLTPLDMVQPITSNTHEKHPSFSTQYLQEQRYITQPSQRDLLYSAASGNLSGNSVSDFTISQGEDEAVENVNTSNVTHNSTESSSSSNGVKNSAVKYSAASAVRTTTMGPPTTIRSPLPHTNNTHTASSSATQSTPNKRYTSSSGASSGGKTSSHPAETQSYQSPSQLSQSAPIVMINNNTSQGNDMVRKGAPVVMTRYKLREKEEIKELEQAEALVGQQVNKKFNGTFYLGTVKTYDAESKLFHIVYDDGDEEDMVMREINRWLYRPDVQRQQPQSSRKTRRNDPTPTPTPTPTPVTTASSGTAEPAIVSTSAGTGTATAGNNTRSTTSKALRTIPEEEQVSYDEGEEKSDGDLTQPQFVTQPDLTQPVVQITRATRSRMSSTEALLYSQANDSEMEGTPAVSTRNQYTTTSTTTSSTRAGIAGMSMEDIRDTPHSLKRFAAELLDGESMRKAPRHQSTTSTTAAASTTSRNIPFVPTPKAIRAASHNITDGNSFSDAEAEEGPTPSTSAAATSLSAPITLSSQEVQLLSDAQLLDYFNTLTLPAGFLVPNVCDYGYNIYNMLRALPGLIAEYLNDLRTVTASHKKGTKGNAPKPVVHKVSSPPRYGSLTLKSTRSGAVDNTKATATSSKQSAVPQHSTSSTTTTSVPVTVSVTTVPVPVISVADLTDAEIKQQYPNPADARRVRMQRAVELSQRKK
eukprot:gene8113-9664_t